MPATPAGPRNPSRTNERQNIRTGPENLQATATREPETALHCQESSSCPGVPAITAASAREYPRVRYLIVGGGLYEAHREGFGAKSSNPKPDYAFLARYAKSNRIDDYIIRGEAIAIGVRPGEEPRRYQVLADAIQYFR